jgi:hypothetical protein
MDAFHQKPDPRLLEISPEEMDEIQRNFPGLVVRHLAYVVKKEMVDILQTKRSRKV